MPSSAQSSVSDRLNRPLRDLRISVIDRCNLRCNYCMPREIYGEGYAFLPANKLLNFDEIVTVAQYAVSLGVRKIRLTGGEPLLRKNLIDLVARLARLPNIELTLTTNGTLFSAHAKALKDAGLHRVTFSLDTLDKNTSAAICGNAQVPSQVLTAIAHAQDVGFAGININMVVQRSRNWHEVLPMAQYFRHTGHTLRFIEYMDVGTKNKWQKEDVVNAHDILTTINAHHPLLPVPPRHSGEVAQRWRYADGAGEIGVINSISQPFCGACNRLRLSADGKLFTCLFASEGFDIKSILRAHDIPLQGRANDVRVQAITDTIRRLWQDRDDQYSAQRDHMLAQNLSEPPKTYQKIEMFYVGG